MTVQVNSAPKGVARGNPGVEKSFITGNFLFWHYLPFASNVSSIIRYTLITVTYVAFKFGVYFPRLFVFMESNYVTDFVYFVSVYVCTCCRCFFLFLWT